MYGGGRGRGTRFRGRGHKMGRPSQMLLSSYPWHEAIILALDDRPLQRPLGRCFWNNAWILLQTCLCFFHHPLLVSFCS